MKNLSVVRLMTILMTILFISCGKDSNDDSNNSVSTTPAISVDGGDQNEYSDANEQFSVTANKALYDVNELVLLEVKNIGDTSLDHLAFNFSSSSEELLISRLNCASDLNNGDKCSFVLQFKSASAGYHQIKITYLTVQLDIMIELQGDNTAPPVDYLRHDLHTFTDCTQTSKLGKIGHVKRLNFENYCSFRGVHWNETNERVEINEDPLAAMKDPNIDANSHYCPANWTLSSLEFAKTIVVEHKNFWGGRRDITIEPGQSKEVCVARNLFGCKETKVFHSRLMNVNCY